MINSKGSLVVVGDEGAQCGLLGSFVVPDGGGEREEALHHAGGDASVGACTVSFEIELAFEGVVDRLDDLTERFEQLLSRPRGPVFVGGSQQPDVVVLEERFE